MADEALQLAQKEIEELVSRLCHGDTTATTHMEILSGSVYPYGEDSTRQVVEGATKDGPFRYITIAEDTQASTPERRDSTREIDCAEEGLSETTLGDKLRNKAIPAEDRSQYLREYLAIDEPSAAAFIVNELENADIDTDWCDVLIFVAEDVQFYEPEVRRRVKNCLFAFVSALRKNSSPRAEHAAFSAIRTYASLIDASEIGNLLSFLEPPIYIDTRLVTIQSVVRVLEASTSLSSHALDSLADRIVQLAKGLLHPDILIPGELAAIAQNAIHALALIGDSRVTECFEQVKHLNKRWFTRQVRQRLEGTLEAWRANDMAGDSSPPCENICDLLNILERPLPCN